MKELICKKCSSKTYVKAGHVRGMQRYKCKECGCQFTALMVWTAGTSEREKKVLKRLKALALKADQIIGDHTMKEIKVLGIDIAKNVFQLHGVDRNGNVVLEKRLARSKLAEFISNTPSCLIGMEACASSNYWALKFESFGHEVKLMSPQYVKPYVKTHKNDARDAEAICEAVTRPNMRFVAIKNKENQAIQCVHRIRQRLVKNKIALSNQMRAILGEYGIVLPQGLGQIQRNLIPLLESHETDLTPRVVKSLKSLHEEFLFLNEKISIQDKELQEICKENEVCRRLMTIKGIGPTTATALVSSIGDINFFKNGRQLSAWLGLVPRQHSSGNKQILLGITKRGDRYLRTLLIHGARSGLGRNKNCAEREISLINRRGIQKACVAFANRNARIVWAIMKHGTEYQPDYGKAA